MYMFGKLLPLLFTSPSSIPSSIPSSVRNININNNNNNAVYQKSNVVLQESTIQDLDTSALESSSSSSSSSVESSVSAPRKIVNDVKSVYADLASGCYSTKDYYSPMIEFKYMSPPHIRDSFTTTSTATDSAATDLNQVFQQIKSQSHGKSDNNDENVDNDTEKTIAIYLPGLDGVGISATTQFDDLSNQYEFWRMYINDKDTTTSYTDLTTIITKFVTDLVLNNNVNENENGKGRKFILIGESFGGLLVPTVALRLQSIFKKMDTQNEHNDSESYNDLLQGLVLVNPATSFDQTQWSTIVPLLASLKYLEQQEEEQKSSSSSTISSAFQLPTPYSVVGGMALAATIPDKNQFQTILNIFSNTKVTTSDELRDVLQSMTDGFGILADKLPADVMEHRVNNWLNVGCMLLNSNSGNNGYGDRLGTLDVETLVIAGEDDNMLPTKKEADRLVNSLPHCTSMTIKGSGHFVLDDRFNLTKAILKAPFSINQKQDSDSDSDSNEKKKVVKKYDPIMDWRPATEKVMQKEIENSVQIFRTLTSPVFFSTGPDGIRKKGLGFVPKDNTYDYNKDVNDNKPLLFVANHQLLGLDLGMIISQLLEERGISARGLAHPVVFQGQGGNGFGGPVTTDDDDSGESRIERRDRNGLIPDEDEDSKQPGGTFQTFGAVMVTPRNYYRLMQSGQTGLLFPGGVREVFHGKDEAYDLFWPEKVDFVRVAARFNATIVPISAVGAADSANILLDAPEILNLPFGLGERAANNTRNTISARFDSSNSDELFQPPLVVPKPLPARQYFVFGKPFNTTPLDHSDKEGCATLYADVKSELRRGLDDILVAREKDPYQNTPTRLAYERLLGKPAPTFPVDELNQ